VITEHAGGYSDWEARGGKLVEVEQFRPVATQQATSSQQPAATADPAPTETRKLSYKDQRELDALPGKIETLEKQQEELEAAIGDPGFFQRPSSETEAALKALSDTQAELELAYERWSALEG
jgi:ATP-binding cassette subfamily F protein uup